MAKDHDERLADAMLRIIEAMRVSNYSAKALEQLDEAERQVRIVLNHGKDQWDPEYRSTERRDDES